MTSSNDSIQAQTLLETAGESPYRFVTKTLPDDRRFMPEIGNGHIATVVFDGAVLMQGLYNGEACASCRARIPSLVGFETAVDVGDLDQTFILDTKEGIFGEISKCPKDSWTLTREIFAHRLHDNLLVTRLHATSVTSGDVTVSLENFPSTDRLVSEDIDFECTEEYVVPGSVPVRHYRIASGRTHSPEVAGQPRSPVTVAWYSTLSLDTHSFTVGMDGLDLVVLTSVGDDREDVARSLLDAIRTGYADLRASHITKWSQYWDTGRIDVDSRENFGLAQTLHSSLYYLLSSLPNKNTKQTFVGLSPGGLAHGSRGVEIDNDYLGHSFWDTEMWMFAPVLFFHPDQARFLIESRLRVLGQAQENAKAVGKDGAKFPWESAVSGKETTPWPPAADQELHITGDIAFAVRQLLFAAADKPNLIRELNLDRLVVEIAAWWQSCVTFDCTRSTCGIHGVMGPDEYHYPVNNSAFTNYVAKLSLQLPAYVLGLIGKSDDRLELWARTAAQMSIPTSTTSTGGVYHPEFDGFTPNPDPVRTGRTVKQADVILLGYPLDMDMGRDVRERDLDTYRAITDPYGPAMTWSMFAVGYLEVDRKADADALFGKYTENAQAPFGVWSEVAGGSGAVNFLTGMGGFLQSVINGYGGFRLRADHLSFNPVALPGTSHWSMTGAKYLGCCLDFTFDFSCDTISATLVDCIDPSVRLALETCSGTVHMLHLNRTVRYPRERSVIRCLHTD